MTASLVAGQSVFTRLRRAFANPWGKARGLAVITWIYVVWSLVPVALAVLFSFNSGRSRSTWQGFSLRWYLGESNSIANDASLQLALRNSVILAALTMAIATPLGVALAIGLNRWRSRTSKAVNGIMLVPLVTPEIVMGVSLFLVFTSVFKAIPLGRPAQLIGHVTFSVSYVVVIVRGRLISIGPVFEEAARDLGATPFQALRMVVLPQLWPAIFAGFVLVFATSIDDFVISSFLSSGAGSETVPMRLYSSVRGSSTPALNALATVMLVLSLAGIGLAVVAIGWSNRGKSGGASRALDDFARMDL
jgi:spermidine/putrescine transport system permease protein